jgi:hypothetical protein
LGTIFIVYGADIPGDRTATERMNLRLAFGQQDRTRKPKELIVSFFGHKIPRFREQFSQEVDMEA